MRIGVGESTFGMWIGQWGMGIRHLAIEVPQFQSPNAKSLVPNAQSYAVRFQSLRLNRPPIVAFAGSGSLAPRPSTLAPHVAHCERGYLCEVCGDEVEEITDSDLYLRYVIGEIAARQLLSAKERHIRCNPTLAQFIVDPAFAAVGVEGPFAKSELDAVEVEQRETLVTRGWRRLQDVRELGLSIAEYPLSQAVEPNVHRDARGQSASNPDGIEGTA